MEEKTLPQIEVPSMSSEAFEGFLKAIAQALDGWLTPTLETKMGFALFVTGVDGEMRYVSNTMRESILPMLKDFIQLNTVDIKKTKKKSSRKVRRQFKEV